MTALQQESLDSLASEAGYVMRCMIMDMCKSFCKDSGGLSPNVIYVTREMERFLEAHHIVDYPNTFSGKLREQENLFGMTPRWNAGSFSLAHVDEEGEVQHVEGEPNVNPKRWWLEQQKTRT